jgi:hypothetical protein
MARLRPPKVTGKLVPVFTNVALKRARSVAEEIAYLLEQRDKPYALLDLDYRRKCGRLLARRCKSSGARRRCPLSSGGWPSMSPAAAVTTCERLQHRSRGLRKLGSKT